MAMSTSALALQCEVNFSSGSFAEYASLSGTGAQRSLPFSYSCSAPVTEQPFDRRVTLCLGLGSGSGGNYNTAPASTRKLRSGQNEKLLFDIYQRNAQQLVWGSLIDGSIGGTPKAIQMELGGLANTGLVSVSGQDTLYAYLKPNQTSASLGFYQSTFSGSDIELAYDYSSRMANCQMAGPQIENGQGGFSISAEIRGQCRVDAQALEFGDVVSMRQMRKTEGVLQVQCVQSTPYQIALSPGMHADNQGKRRMHGNDESYVHYQIFQDEARTSAWGDSWGNNTSNGVANGQIQLLTLFGAAPAQPLPAAGRYMDQVVVTVRF